MPKIALQGQRGQWQRSRRGRGVSANTRSRGCRGSGKKSSPGETQKEDTLQGVLSETVTNPEAVVETDPQNIDNSTVNDSNVNANLGEVTEDEDTVQSASSTADGKPDVSLRRQLITSHTQDSDGDLDYDTEKYADSSDEEDKDTSGA